jgi:NAD(P)-dependent dehydrogenase (short-subunit alcohol dehydrogenase family)
LAGRAVFITGGSRGLGQAFAVAYAKAGVSHIGLGARSSLESTKNAVQDAAKEAGREPPKVLAVDLDVTDEQSTEKAAQEVKTAFGRLDILVNNAGFMEADVKMLEVDAQEWWRSFEVNVLGAYLTTRAFLPKLLETSDGLKTVLGNSSIWYLLLKIVPFQPHMGCI